MKILVTGAKGFIGRNLISVLEHQTNHEILSCDVETDVETLDKYCENAEFVFHLAGINRPDNVDDYVKGNFGFTELLISLLKSHNNYCPIVLSSSIQAVLDNPYGRSKLMGENTLLEYSNETAARVIIYRFQNVFGKWSRPNYNSVVSTFCHNIANGVEINIHNPLTEIELIYIDDIVKELVKLLSTRNLKTGYYQITPSYNVCIGDLANLLLKFRDSRLDLSLPNLLNGFEKKLYSTYLSFLPTDSFNYKLKMNNDERGSFTEFIRTVEKGQFSINLSKPGVVKGNHWHSSKVEKFLVIKGEGVIRLRKLQTEKIIEYFVNDSQYDVIDIPPGYTHNIENLGKNDMITLMWVNEPYDIDAPDTFFEKV